MSTSPVQRFLPTLARMRASYDMLPSDEPMHIEPLAMLVVKAALLRRTSWTDEAESAPGHIQRGEPPVPGEYESRHHVRIDERLGGGTCLACLQRPGFRKCRVCYGTGMADMLHKCSCSGGWITCPTCNGTQQVDRVRLRYYTDAPAFLNEAYMPSHVAQDPALFHLESKMEGELGLANAIPDELRCHDLTGEVVGTAYRGGSRTVRPMFHGHDFGDTIDKALAGLSAVAGGANVVRYQVHAYAWPFLRVRWMGFHDFAAYVDRWGSLQVFHGTFTMD